MERPVIYFVTCAKAEMVLFCRFLSANYKLIPRTIKLQCYLLLLHLIIIIPKIKNKGEYYEYLQNIFICLKIN